MTTIPTRGTLTGDQTIGCKAEGGRGRLLRVPTIIQDSSTLIRVARLIGSLKPYNPDYDYNTDNDKSTSINPDQQPRSYTTIILTIVQGTYI